MRNRFRALFLALLIPVAVGTAYSQERPMDMGPRMREGRPPMPMPDDRAQDLSERRGRGMMMKMMRENPKLAGMMMQMRGEMMRIRGEAQSKMGEVLKRYGERLEKEGLK